jgi:hypothetical protein
VNACAPSCRSPRRRRCPRLRSRRCCIPAASPVKEATKHSRRGVALYDEADYRGALTDFKRAYEIDRQACNNGYCEAQ